MKTWIALFFLVGISFARIAHGENLGVIGATYPIKEPDLLQEIHQKLTQLAQTGQLQAMANKMQKKARFQLENPAPVTSVSTTTRQRVWYDDPSIVLSQDIRNNTGELLWSKGAVINPLNIMPLKETLLFINGSEPAQVRFAQTKLLSTHQPVKVILVAGNWVKLMKAWNLPIYFDQGGKLSHRFHLQYVPCLVSQAGDKLRIDEEVPLQ